MTHSFRIGLGLVAIIVGVAGWTGNLDRMSSFSDGIDDAFADYQLATGQLAAGELAAGESAIDADRAGGLAMAETDGPAPAAPRVAESSAEPVQESQPAPEPDPGRVPTPDVFRGVNVLWYDADLPPSHTRAQAERIVDHLVDLGANSAMISIPIFMDGARSSDVYLDARTPDASTLAILVDEAHRSGIYVTIRPLFDEHAFKVTDDWRGSIRPADVDGWFADYANLVAHLATVAERVEADEFVLGAELSSLGEYKSLWATVEQAGRENFSGPLSYSNNWDLYTHSFDYTGVDAYFSIDLPADASVEELTDAFAFWYDEFRVGKSIPADELVMHEVGIPSVSGIYQTPWYWSSPNPTDHQAQVRWFTAACQAAKIKQLKGVYYWKLDFHHDFGQDYTDDRSGNFNGKPGEDAIRACFRPLDQQVGTGIQ